jgi:Dolichyl-phosphate-mannose-protein mannosyltransferase
VLRLDRRGCQVSDSLTLLRVDTADTAPIRSQAGRTILYWLPVAVILAFQFLLTVRLIPAPGVAAHDEALYIEAGHQLIWELFHGGGSPYYETWFSGAPVVYSPLAAMADYVGGIVAVSLMSAVFMQVAAMMLFLTGRRLFGYWPAVCGCALWAGLSLTQVVGRNAVYDALALMLLTVAAYFASRTTARDPVIWLLLLPVMLLAADAAKYVTLLFNPTVVLISAYQIRELGIRAVLRRVLVLGSTSIALMLLALLLAGSAYLKGIMLTSLGRQGGNIAVLFGAVPTPTSVIVSEAWHWFGLVVVMAFAAAALASMFPSERDRLWFLVTLAVTTTLVTLEAIHLGSDESMGRHDDFGAWFGCLAGGYLVALLVRKLPRYWLKVGAAVVAAAVIGCVGYTYTGGAASAVDSASIETTADTPNLAILRPYLQTGQRYLLDGKLDYTAAYNDHIVFHWWNLINDAYIKYPVPGRGGNWHGTVRGPACLTLRPGCMYLEGNAGYVAAIRAHAFAVISITRPPGLSLPSDIVIERAAESTAGYVLLTTAGGGPTWIYLPDYEHHS